MPVEMHPIARTEGVGGSEALGWEGEGHLDVFRWKGLEWQ